MTSESREEGERGEVTKRDTSSGSLVDSARFLLFRHSSHAFSAACKSDMYAKLCTLTGFENRRTVLRKNSVRNRQGLENARSETIPDNPSVVFHFKTLSSRIRLQCGV
jgi:hypothetical protein